MSVVVPPVGLKTQCWNEPAVPRDRDARRSSLGVTVVLDDDGVEDGCDAAYGDGPDGGFSRLGVGRAG
jgi:hypothetical protein